MTPTQRKAMEQALEALMATHYKMIDAGLLDQDLLNKNFTAHEALKDALAEQPVEQEPVATYMGHRETPTGTLEFWGVAEKRMPRGTDLYTQPPPTKRVPLTREHVRASGGIVHSDGNVFFTSLDQLNGAIERATGVTGDAEC